jgi:hypothetical protein
MWKPSDPNAGPGGSPTSAAKPGARPPIEGLLGLSLLAAWTALRLLAPSALELSEEEARLWVWGQHPAAGYADGPPLPALLGRLGELIVGHSELGLRAPFVLLGGLTAAVAALPARDRELTLLLLATAPGLAFSGLWAGPAAPLLAGWTLALVAASRGAWVLTGIAAGIAAQSSAVGLLLLPSLLLSDLRGLRAPGPWIGLAVAGALLLPYLWWNLGHDSLGLREGIAPLITPAPTPAAFGATLLGLGPVGPLLLIWLLIGWRGDRLDRVCWWGAAPTLLLSALTGAWTELAAVAWVGPIIGVARWGGRWSRAAWAAGGVAAVVCLLGLTHLRWPLGPLPNDPRDRFAGGRTIAESVAAWDIPVVFTAGAGEAALIQYYSGLAAAPLPGVESAGQYDLWPAQLVEHALYVRPWRGNEPVAADALGYEHGPAHGVSAWVNLTDGEGARLLRRWQVYELSHAAPEPSPSP